MTIMKRRKNPSHDYDDADDGQPPCPMCNGPLGVLGTLGNVTHYSCRNCGGQTDSREMEHREKRAAAMTIMKRRKNPAKRLTVADLEAIEAIPKNEIRYLVGTYHVSTPSEEIEARIRSLATKAKWPSPVITAAVLYARKAHQKNVDLFRSWRF
jgi:hypothetical protein